MRPAKTGSGTSSSALHQPLNGADRRQRPGRDSADEPHVGQIEHDLHRTVRHQRQRQCHHGVKVLVAGPMGVETRIGIVGDRLPEADLHAA